MLRRNACGYWWFLGHVDPGEDFLTAALRETEEEANIAASELDVHKDFEEDLFYEVKLSRYEGEVTKQVLFFGASCFMFCVIMLA